MNYKYFIFAVLSFCSIYSKHHHLFPQKMIACSAVANLRTEPKDIPAYFTLPSSFKTNPLQSTQLLFNEYVIALKNYTDQKNEKWLFIKTLQQPNYSDHTWSQITGWVKAQDLCGVEHFLEHNLIVYNRFASIYDTKNNEFLIVCMGTQLTGTLDTQKNMYKIVLPNKKDGWIKTTDVKPLSKNDEISESALRQNIIQTAKKFLNDAYSWGGRSPQTDLWPVSSVDCSGLTNLVYITNGLLIPRNSGSQYRKSHEIKYSKDLQPADLIFFANNENKVSHVMLYIGDGNILESALTPKKVRIISFKERIGFDIKSMKSGDLSGPITTSDSTIPIFFKVFFGSFLSNHHTIKKLQHNLVKFNY